MIVVLNRDGVPVDLYLDAAPPTIVIDFDVIKEGGVAASEYVEERTKELDRLARDLSEQANVALSMVGAMWEAHPR